MMDRGEFLRRAGLGIAVAPYLLAGGPRVEATELSRPNILVLLSDDQPYRSATRAHMPKAWDFLGRRAARFQRAYVDVCRCGPSRASFLTGLYPDRTGVPVNNNAVADYRENANHLRDLPLWLREEAGYRTALFGKFLNDYNAISSWVPPGWTDWHATVRKGDTRDDPMIINLNGEVREASYTPRGEARELAERVAAYVGRATEPFFCVYAPGVPHKPPTPSKANKGSYDGRAMWDPPNMFAHDENKPAEVRVIGGFSDAEKDDLKKKWRGSMEEVRDLDNGVAKIMAAVDLSTTLVVFATDNSTMFGEHRLINKSQPYEESSRTHLWVAGTGIAAGPRSPLALNVDLAATFCELAGLPERAGQTDGRSLRPVLEVEEGFPWRNALHMHLPPDPAPNKQFEGWRSIRTEERLYVEHGTGERELYDMVNDPYQLKSLQNEPERADEIAALSERLRALSGASGNDLRSAETA